MGSNGSTGVPGQQGSLVTLAKLHDIKTDNPLLLKASLHQIQNNNEKALQSLFSVAPILSGRLLCYRDGADDLRGTHVGTSAHLKSRLDQNRIVDRITLGVGQRPLAIPHGLGRAYRGWMIVRRFDVGEVYESFHQDAPELQQDSYDPARYLTLSASSVVTVSLWVF